MKASNENLLVKFRSKDTQFGVTRTTVKAIAKELDVNETQVIHMALSKFACTWRHCLVLVSRRSQY